MRAALVVLLLLTGIATADTHASKAGKVSIDLPKKWPVAGAATDTLLRAASPDNTVAFVFWVMDTYDTKEVLTTLEGELYSAIQGLKWVDKTKKLKIHNLPSTWIEGVGVNGAAKELDILVTVSGPTATKKGAVMLAVVEHDKLAANKKAIEAIFQSLRPTK
jgi:hypothetical protein